MGYFVSFTISSQTHVIEIFPLAEYVPIDRDLNDWAFYVFKAIKNYLWKDSVIVVGTGD